MEAGAQSFHLPESRLGASSWHSQLIETSFWVFLGTFLVFLCNFLVLTRLPGPANGSFGSQLWFAGVPAEGGALAPRSDKNKFPGDFSEHFGSLFVVFWFGWAARIGLQFGGGEAVADGFYSTAFQLDPSCQAQERNRER